jgi:transcriptional regulator with XRE-family HTH domain
VEWKESNMNDELAQISERSDIRGMGLQCRLRREALGLTRRDMAVLMGVEESTVYRWERGMPPRRLELMLEAFETKVEDIKVGLYAAIQAFGQPFGTVSHNDLHIAVPKPGAQVGTVWVFGKEDQVLDHAPVNLLRALAGQLVAGVDKSKYLVFVQEVGDTDMLLFTQAGQSISTLESTAGSR